MTSTRELYIQPSNFGDTLLKNNHIQELPSSGNSVEEPEKKHNYIEDFLKIIIDLEKSNFFHPAFKLYFSDENFISWYNIPYQIFKFITLGITLTLEILFRLCLAIILLMTLITGFILLLDTVGIIKKEDIGCIVTLSHSELCNSQKKQVENLEAAIAKAQSSKSNESSAPIPLKDRGSKYITIPAFIPSE